MKLNVVDDTDPALISKKFWKYVKSKTKSTIIPACTSSAHYNEVYRVWQSQTTIPETVWYKKPFSKQNH